jgi:hypothetical protein
MTFYLEDHWPKHQGLEPDPESAPDLNPESDLNPELDPKSGSVARGTDPQIQIRTKMSRIRNTAKNFTSFGIIPPKFFCLNQNSVLLG